jgi:hypothetical protein
MRNCVFWGYNFAKPFLSIRYEYSGSIYHSIGRDLRRRSAKRQKREKFLGSG